MPSGAKRLRVRASNEELAVASSVLEAIKLGLWDFEPEQADQADYIATEALPGTDAKLAVMADRVKQGLPLWHPADVRNYHDLNSRREGRSSRE